MVQKRPSARTTFPQFDESKGAGPKSASEGKTTGESVNETVTTELPLHEDESPENDRQKTSTPPSVPVAIINL